MKKRLIMIAGTAALLTVFIFTLCLSGQAGQTHGATISKNAVYNGDGTITSIILVTNTDTYGDTLTLTLVQDTVHHASGDATHSFTIPSPGIIYPPSDADPAHPKYMQFTYTYPLETSDNNPIVDTAYVQGTDSGLPSPYNVFVFTFPATTSYPVPEIAAGVLLGGGLLAMGGFIWTRRRQSETTA
jgi:hypothetical protein